MSDIFFIHIARTALGLILLLSAPALGVGLLVGLVISIFQATTQIQEQTLTFVPKLLAVSIVLVVLAPWLLNMMTDFTVNLYSQLPLLTR